jgi:DNA-binding MarR family transcriptional regulator
MSELSEQSLHSRSRLTQRVDRLVERGLVRREKCPEDRRGTFAVLTDEGFARIRDAAPGHVEAVRVALIDRLTPEELRTGTEILKRLTRRPNHD